MRPGLQCPLILQNKQFLHSLWNPSVMVVGLPDWAGLPSGGRPGPCGASRACPPVPSVPLLRGVYPGCSPRVVGSVFWVGGLPGLGSRPARGGSWGCLWPGRCGVWGMVDAPG